MDRYDPTTEGTDNRPVKTQMVERLNRKARIANFKGATIVEVDGAWLPMTSERFARLCYNTFGPGIAKNKISDLEHYFRANSPDLSDKARYIAFGVAVWDTHTLDWTEEVASEDCVYRIPYQSYAEDKEKIPFILDLACGDEGVYDDIMQSVAPLLMEKKPTGVIWYLGSGANGKSTLVHLLYLIFGPYLTELTVKQLEDERDTPQLNGKIGNVCKESSEGFVEDTRTYKSIGTHEGFSVHKFHSQDMVDIEGNVHHIFSANNIPTFGDKSYGARRRTLVIPFNARFKPDETFEERTFTANFIERFIAEMLSYARRLQEQNYEYEFSATTKAMKERYDTDANTASTYADEIWEEGVRGFLGFNHIANDYENWCLEHGYKTSSINVLRRAIADKGFERRSVREDNKVKKMYLTPALQPSDLQLHRVGIFRLAGDTPALIPEETQQEILEEW